MPRERRQRTEFCAIRRIGTGSLVLASFPLRVVFSPFPVATLARSPFPFLSTPPTTDSLLALSSSSSPTTPSTTPLSSALPPPSPISTRNPLVRPRQQSANPYQKAA